MAVIISVSDCTAFHLDTVYIDFNHRLHARDDEFTVFGYNSYRPDPDDSLILQGVLNRLINDNIGVLSVIAQHYTLEIRLSRSVTSEEVLSYIKTAIRRQGESVIVERNE